MVQKDLQFDGGLFNSQSNKGAEQRIRAEPAIKLIGFQAVLTSKPRTLKLKLTSGETKQMDATL